MNYSVHENYSPEENERFQRTISALIESLAGGHSSPVELADIIISNFLGGPESVVSDYGQVWRFHRGKGLFEPVPQDEFTRMIYALNNAPVVGAKPFKATTSIARAIAGVICAKTIRRGFFDGAPDGLMVANGFLALNGKKIGLEEPATYHRQRQRLDITFSEDATCPKTEAFLLKTFGTAEVVTVFFEALGVALLGLGSKFQRAFILVGNGSNGKGVAERLMELIMPEGSVSAIPPSEMSVDYQRWALKDSRLNLVGEFGNFGRAGWPALKAAIAGDPITVRRVQETGFQVRPRALHVSSTNHLPDPPETGFAILRRFRVMEAIHTVLEADANRDLARELYGTEKEGILRQSILAVGSVIERGSFSDPECMKSATITWLYRANPVSPFAEDMLERSGADCDRIGAVEMYAQFGAYCAKIGFPRLSMRTFAGRMEDLGFRKLKSSSNFWVGVKLCHTGATGGWRD